MDGNRGAKGSIKDRLISMLYRIRYAKKVKKEEEYEIAKKEKQVEYLKKLIRLEETENVDILDSSDKKELDKVKFNANFKVEEKNNSPKKRYKIKKKGIEIVDLNLQSIELKTSELDTKVELKQELKKTKNEVVILKEVDKFIEESKKNLEEINTEVQVLKEMSKEKNQDTKELEERYKRLREKVEKLKKQYDAVKERYDLSEFSILESIKLMDNIVEYKGRANLNEMDMMIKVCKKEISKIENVTIEHQETKKIGANVDQIKKDQKNVKIKFHKSQENIKKIDMIETEIEDELKTQEEIIEEMYKEAAYFEKIARKEVEFSGFGNMLSALARIAGGVLTLPFSGSRLFGVALGNTMINRGLKKLNQSLEPKTKIVYEYKYTDIAHKISEVKDKVEYTNLIINDNLNEIDKLRDNFKKYKEYNKVLPNYEKMLNKIDKIEEKLKLQQQKIYNMDKKLDEEKAINQKKMSKVMNKDK